MNLMSRNLYELLMGCEGNWRNAIYISCGPCLHPCRVDSSGCLMTINEDGSPRLVSIRKFEKETGERIDPTDCIGTLSKAAFSSLFSRYLIWEMSSPKQCPMEYLTGSTLCISAPKRQKKKG